MHKANTGRKPDWIPPIKITYTENSKEIRDLMSIMGLNNQKKIYIYIPILKSQRSYLSHPI